MAQPCVRHRRTIEKIAWRTRLTWTRTLAIVDDKALLILAFRIIVVRPQDQQTALFPTLDDDLGFLDRPVGKMPLHYPKRLPIIGCHRVISVPSAVTDAGSNIVQDAVPHVIANAFEGVWRIPALDCLNLVTMRVGLTAVADPHANEPEPSRDE